MKHLSFGWILLVSAALHGGTAWYFHFGYQPPVALPTRPGYVSIQMRASVASAPKSAEEPAKKPAPKPLETLPAPKIVATQQDAPRAVTQPKEAEPKEKNEPEPIKKVEPESKKPEPEKKVEQPKQKAASQPSLGSMGSDASVGTRVDVLPGSRPTNPEPPYPAADLLAGRQGTVVLHLKIDATGKVTHAHVHQSSGSPTLDQSALSTVYVWQFEPGRFLGRAVPAEVLKPFEFRILGRFFGSR